MFQLPSMLKTMCNWSHSHQTPQFCTLHQAATVHPAPWCRSHHVLLKKRTAPISLLAHQTKQDNRKFQNMKFENTFSHNPHPLTQWRVSNHPPCHHLSSNLQETRPPTELTKSNPTPLSWTTHYLSRRNTCNILTILPPSSALFHH